MRNINRPFIEEYKHYFFVFIGIVSISLLLVWVQYKSHSSSDEESTLFQMSENVPEGFVVIPIELENYESINDLILSHGVVDLYYRPSPPSPPVRIASAVRILRLQPLRFVALIPENQTSLFLSSSLNFYAVVQNINKQEVIIYGRKKKRSIMIEEEVPSHEM